MKFFTHTLIVNLVFFLAPVLFSPLPTFDITEPSQALSAESSESLDSQEAQVWASGEQCNRVVEQGGQMAFDTASTLRLEHGMYVGFQLGNLKPNPEMTLIGPISNGWFAPLPG